MNISKSTAVLTIILSIMACRTTASATGYEYTPNNQYNKDKLALFSKEITAKARKVPVLQASPDGKYKTCNVGICIDQLYSNFRTVVLLNKELALLTKELPRTLSTFTKKMRKEAVQNMLDNWNEVSRYAATVASCIENLGLEKSKSTNFTEIFQSLIDVLNCMGVLFPAIGEMTPPKTSHDFWRSIGEELSNWILFNRNPYNN
ncbi:MAG: hypothetical protein LBL32_01625 [Holosporales bacterium]|jgi:hypothetical protein|nr:hypothetical protein [Holosporales bacterium]